MLRRYGRCTGNVLDCNAFNWLSISLLIAFSVAFACSLSACSDESIEDNQESAQLISNNDSNGTSSETPSDSALSTNGSQVSNDTQPTSLQTSPTLVDAGNVTTLKRDALIEVEDRLVYLGPVYGKEGSTNFTIELEGQDGETYSIMGELAIPYQEITSMYPDVRAGLKQIGPTTREYDMTVRGTLSKYRDNPETGGINGFDMSGCTLVAMAPRG